ncbi:MAG: ATP-binding protein [Acidaminococcaceae bacterium]|nr:ATP-binding protein [Acidaminococcaceae bacterium]MBQ6743683.1 ATP-binding protein [Acidaminococcaceae bacterium]MBQ6779248.1 ATP-binding protein [Acidaminococcaceae bacterium]MBR6817139.1 ATP-binding protein [Acidaminococcaceae bacterium]
MKNTDLRNLVVCRDLLEDPVIQKIIELVEFREKYPSSPAKNRMESFLQSEVAALLIQQAEKLGISGNLLPAYIVHLLAEGGNVAARTIEAVGSYGKGLLDSLGDDMILLLPYLKVKTTVVIGRDNPFLNNYHPAKKEQNLFETNLLQRLVEMKTITSAARHLLRHYEKWGSGMMARYTAFRIGAGGTLIGIADFPVFNWDDLLGYEDQKYKLLTNTQNFMEGRPANNVLLTGARGTGKSTGVKALAAMFAADGLRLIQIGRDQLELVAPVLEKLNEIRSKKFILFFDDLSFDEGESGYKYLKSAIDGSVTAQPDNVLIYATSNRRHLLKETWSDRNDALEAEVYRQDSANESISLSDRFGLILHYSTPSQEEYLQIIDHELRKAGVHLSKEELRLEGVRWEMEHSGRNGRIANQFVKWYLGNN